MFERDLRAMLAGRDPGPAPASLAIAVHDRFAESRRLPRPTMAGRAVGGAALLASIAAVLVLTLIVARPPTSVGPGAQPSPSLAGTYTIGAGDGVVTGDWYPVAQIAVALVVLAVLLRLYVTTAARWRRAASVIGVLVLGFVSYTIPTSDAIGFVDGVDGVDPGRATPDNQSGLYVNVTGDQPFTLSLTVTNTSKLPLDVEGLVEPRPSVPGEIELPRFVGMAVIPDVSVDLTTAPVTPFQPVTLAPGGSVSLAIRGMAGSCAIADPAAGNGTFEGIDDVGIVYEQLTLRHTASVVLPETVVIATAGGPCR
jgi:hypothetical protein